MNIVTSLARSYLTLARPIRRRGFRTFMRAATALFPAQAAEVAQTRLDRGQVFTFPVGDAYWQYYVLTGIDYESELTLFIERLQEKPVLFLDCGANFGYWSVKLSVDMPCVAVEPSTETGAILERNRAANDNRFTVVKKAVSDGSSDYVSFTMGADHAGRTISADPGAVTERVPATSIDALVRDHAPAEGLILIKLDVEGAEIAAITGAAQTMQRACAFLYEDHGNDMTCAPTAHLLGLGKRVYAMDDDGRLVRITSVEEARALKKNPHVGYSFMALGDATSEPRLG
ncbi:FkbM family methyltransferase [Paracoccus sp. p3-h83]|uniref:FkbM family methyltransferase n=1 Tax=Paracoccus sp. p3-h83 TaxID=3342805 RepID=UPI0035B99584